MEQTSSKAKEEHGICRLVCLQKLRKEGLLNHLIEIGIASIKWITYMEVVEYYDKLVVTGTKIWMAKKITADYFGVSERTVYYAIKALQYEDRDVDSNEK